MHQGDNTVSQADHSYTTLRLKPPSREEIARYDARLHPQSSANDIDRYVAQVADMLVLFDGLATIDDFPVSLRYQRRDPGRVPDADEDPYNAIIRFCEVKGANTGPLKGKRIGVKDNIPVACVPITGGRRREPTPVPREDAIVVERLLDSGATIVAKTNMGIGQGPAEFGETRNPRDPRFSTGGSSSGSAAAVAAGIVDTALGTDIGGSIRHPSAWCGIVGMKATYGLVPSCGLTINSGSQIGPMTTTVLDNAVMLEVIAGGHWREPYWVGTDPAAGEYTSARMLDIDNCRIGVITDALEPSGCTAATMQTFEKAQQTLTACGAEIVHVRVPLWTCAFPIWSVTLALGRAALTGSTDLAAAGRIDPNLLSRVAVENGKNVGDRALQLAVEHIRCTFPHQLVLAQNARLELGRQIDAALADVDILITPTTPTAPFKLSDQNFIDTVISTRNTTPLNVTGHPALTIPSGTADNGLPTGLQIIGRRFNERSIYSVAFAFESARHSR